MAHQPNHRRTLATPNTMDPTHKKYTFTTSSTTTKHRHHPHPHPQPDPTILPPTTIQNISHRFTKLYLNHKQTVQNSSKPQQNNTSVISHSQSQSQLPLHPEPDTDLQTKPPPSFSPVSNTSCTALTKSNSQHERNIITTKNMEYYYTTKNKVKGRDETLKKPSSKKDIIKTKSLQEFDVKKGSQLMMPEGEKIEEVRRVSVSSVGGRRKSFCSSQVELADFLSCSGVKVVAVDMPPFMQIHAVDCARKTHDSLEKFTSKTLALTLKKEFDGVYGPAWHCIVGTSFGSFVTHSVGGFMYFSMDHKIYVLLFKTTVQRAE